MITITTDPGPSRKRIRHCSLLVTTALVLTLVFAAEAFAATGNLIQKPGTDGCISETGSGGACTDGKALEQANSVTVSPDGKNVYVTSGNDSTPPTGIRDAVAIFDRDTATGELTQKPGLGGCVSETGSGGACANGKALLGASSVTVSADGKSVYVKSTFSNAVAIFDRDTATGTLTQKPGLDGCISEDGSGGACTDGKNLIMSAQLDWDRTIVVSPDGKSVYVTSPGSVGIAIFDRDPVTGKLTQKPGLDGCLRDTNASAGECTGVVNLGFPRSLAVSPDGKTVYVTGAGLLTFDRDPTGKLTHKPPIDTCVVENEFPGTVCTSVTVSPDGLSVFTTGLMSTPIPGIPGGQDFYDLTDIGGVGSRDRDPATGGLTQGGDDACVGRQVDSTVLVATEVCGQGVALQGAGSVAVTPDAKSVYVASAVSDAVAVLDYDQAGGKLTQKLGNNACIAEFAPFFCADGRGLEGTSSVTVSPDGESVYVASRGAGAISVFDRDPDGIAPTTTIDSGPSGATNDPSPNFAFSASEAGSTFECNLDSEGFLPCSSPKSYPKFALDEGAHTFSVRATDVNLNTGVPTTRNFTVDRTVDGTASAAKTQKQKGKKIVVEAKVAAKENLDAEASGSVKVNKSAFKLKPAADAVAGGKSAMLKLKPAKSKDAKKIARSLKKSNVTASIDVTLTDDAGNSSKSKLSVTLKG